jgi:hypothetical protein
MLLAKLSSNPSSELSSLLNTVFSCPNFRQALAFFSTASTDPILALALVMAINATCSAILNQSYGKSLEQFWHIFALFWD